MSLLPGSGTIYVEAAVKLCNFEIVRVGNFSLFKRKEPSRSEWIKELVGELVNSESEPPPDFIAELPLADGQTPDGALAEWYALNVSAMAFALWASLGTEDKVIPIIRAFQAAFLRNLSPDCKSVFLEIASKREVAYVYQIRDTLRSGEAAQAMRLASSMG